MPDSRTPTVICPPDHTHGDKSTCYHSHRCRCRPCRDALAARERARRREQAYGTYKRARVSTEPSRNHLNDLRGRGMSLRTITRVSGVPATTLNTIVWGTTIDGVKTRSKTIAKTTADKILAVTFDLEALPDATKIDSRGTLRRLRALRRMGWTCESIGARIGFPGRRFRDIHDGDFVTAETARYAVAAFDLLWDKEPPLRTPTERSMAARSRSLARRHGWPGPLDWDDIDADGEPPAEEDTDEDGIDESAIESALAGHQVPLTTAERQRCVVVLHAKRWSDGLIADHLRCSEKTVLRDRQQLGLPAIEQTELITRSAA